jgi:hypothetical protein
MIVPSVFSDIDWRSSAMWRRARKRYGLFFRRSTSAGSARSFAMAFGQRIARAAAATFIPREEPALQEIGDVAQRRIACDRARPIQLDVVVDRPR